MRGSTACRSASGRSARPTPAASAAATTAAGDVVRLAERQAQRAHQPVGQVGGGGEAGAGRRRHGRAVGLQVGDHAGHGGDAQLRLSKASKVGSLSSCMSFE